MRNIPHVGLRTIKTALSVMVCLAIFLPFYLFGDEMPVPWSFFGPLNACIASIICMQSSMEDSWKQGFIRLRGTAIGGIVGLIVIFVYEHLSHPLVLVLLLGAAMVAVIWFCNLIQKPRACGIGCIVCCIVILTQAGVGAERYLAALSRMVETAVGILVSLGINRFLPGLPPEHDDPPTQ